MPKNGNMILKHIAYIFFLIPLSACDSEGNLGREESAVWHKRVSAPEKVEYFTPKCRAYGYADGTAEMRQCVVEEIRRSEKRASDRADAANSSLLMCTTIGNTTTCY